MRQLKSLCDSFGLDYYDNLFSEWFTCENNVKIPIRKRCNGIYDCRYKKPINSTDFSDEKNCNRKFH